MSKKAIIVGATSGIGKQLAIEMHQRGYTVGLTGRRTERLSKVETKLKNRVHTHFMDVAQPDDAREQLQLLVNEMNGMDIIVLNAGVSNYQGDMSWEKERQVVEVNVRGFVALANWSFDYFERHGNGHLVGVSSISGLFGWGLASTYSASKAFVNNYLQAYRQRANHSEADITVTDLQPGFVESEMTEGKKGMFWVAPVEKAARQMANAIEAKRNHAYITRRWRLVAWLIKCTPSWIWNRM